MVGIVEVVEVVEVAEVVEVVEVVEVGVDKAMEREMERAEAVREEARAGAAA